MKGRFIKKTQKKFNHGIRLMILTGVMLYVMSIVSLQISTLTAFAGDENIDVNPNFEKELLKEDTEPEVKDEFQSLDGEEVKATVLFEDTSKRTPTEKHFKMSDGSYVANIFSYDVHYLENDKYEEIDNSLVKTAKGSYTNHKNRFKVELPQSIQDGAKSKVSVDGYSLSFTLLNQKAGKVKEPLVKNLSDSKVIKAQKDFKYDLKTQSSMLYRFADEKVELEHSIVGSSMKENIIINKPLKEYVFEYAIEVENLKLVLTDEGDVVAFDKDEKSIFTIPKGYMFDSDNVRSDDVKYDLEVKGKNYLLKVLPNADWLNDSARKFPITIDPTVTLSSSDGEIKTACALYYWDGLMPATNTFFSFIDFNLPQSLNKTVILRAVMNLYMDPINSSANLNIWENLNEFDGHCPPDNSQTNDGKYINYYYDPNTTIEPYDKICIDQGGEHSFDITYSLKNKIDFEGCSSFHGFAFNTESTDGVFITSEGCSIGHARPSVEIYYRSMVGLESYWDYDCYSIGNNNIYINTYNDEATIVHSNAGINTTSPFVVQHVYMDRYSGEFFDVDNVFANYHYGYGWKLNYQQVIRHRKVFDFEYYDADGTLHYFCYDEALSSEMGQSVAVDEDGLGLKMCLIGAEFKMTDINNNEKWFDYHGRLFKTVDRNGNTVNIVYGNGNQSTVSGIPITEINDNNGHAIYFNYNGSGLLTSLSYKRADGTTTGTTSYTYSSNNLSRITNDDSTYSQYEYDTFLLQRITTENGYSIKLIMDRTGVTSFGLTNLTNLYEPPTAKVRSVWHGYNQEFVHIRDNVYCHGLTYSVTANAGQQYVGYSPISVYNNEDIGSYMDTCSNYFDNNYRIKKCFDLCGRLVSSYVDSYASVSIDTIYNSSETNSVNVNNNKPVASTSYVSNVTCFGDNMSFEDIDEEHDEIVPHWTINNSVQPYKYAHSSTKYASHGKNSLEMYVATPSNFSVEQQVVLADLPGLYTISGSIRVENVLIPGPNANSEGYGAYIYLTTPNNQFLGRSEYITTSLSSDNNGFVDVSFTCGKRITLFGAKIYLAMQNCAGLVYFDKLQLNYTPYGENTTYNNAIKGAFPGTGEHWNLWANCSGYKLKTNNQTDETHNGLLYTSLYNNGSGSVNLYQRVPIENNTTSKVSKTYDMSVWLKRSGKLYAHSSDAYIGLNYKLYDENWSDITGFVLRTIDLTFEIWYKLSVNFVVPSNARYVEINIQSNMVEGTIFIDNVSLVQSAVVNYGYDSFGNNNYYSDGTNVYEYNKRNDNATDSTSNYDVSVNNIDEYGITKDSHGNVISSADLTRNVKTSYTYDNFGRETSSVFSTLNNSYKIGSYTNYSSISNNLIDVVTTTDSLGFQTISNSYAYSGLLMKTTFNDGSYVEYDYGSGSEFSALPASIIIRNKTAGGSTLTSTTYNYYTMADVSASNNPQCIHVGTLKSVVMPNGTVYSYEYDKWGNTLAVKLNNVTQISYVYNADGSLASKTLANGYTETYGYDYLYHLNYVEGRDANNTVIKRYSYDYSMSGDLVATYDELNLYCYKQAHDSSGKATRYMQGSYQIIGNSCWAGDYEHITYIQSSPYGDVDKNIDIEISSTEYSFNCTTSSLTGVPTRSRAGLVETISVGNTVVITYTYNSADKDYGRVIVEDNKLIKNSTYPNGVRFVYTRDLDGNITAITVSQYGTSANGTTYASPYKFLTESYEFDNGYVNLWNFKWMQQNQPAGASQIIEKITDDEEYNGVIIKDIIKLHQGSFYANSQYHSLVDTGALKSGIKGDKITFWAKMLAVPAGITYAPCLIYSDGSHSPYQAFERNTDWQFFSITVDKSKTAVSLRLPWYYGTWLKIGNMSIYAEKNAWDMQWALDHVVNQAYAAQYLPQERISDTDIVTDIIKFHQNTYFVGNIGNTEVFNSLIDPNVLANSGDCITLTYRARIDTLKSEWINTLSQSEMNTRIRALRFRYSDDVIDYGSGGNLVYTTNWQSYSITSAPGKKVVGIEIGYNFDDWVRIGNIRITAQNLGRLDDRLVGQTLYNNNYIDYEYDELGRQTGIEVKAQKHAATNILAETYSYLNGTTTNGQINTSYTVTSKAIEYGTNNGITYNYTYCMDNPALGSVKTQRSNPYNVWQIKEGNTVKVAYEYDLLGRLIREDNTYVNATITYTYDSNNNLLSKISYAYSPNLATANLSGGSTKSYVYGDSTYHDRLTTYNGQSIYYDALGNPTNYFGKTLTWQGRELVGFVSGGVTKTFKYDVNGMRMSKTVGSTVTKYLYSGSKLIHETKGADSIYYLYEQTGMVGLEINGIPYYYVRNLQGDVMKIIDGSGNVVVQYVYDSWGKVLSVSGSLASTVGAKNPIRYRGYYYDTETELYYLNSRYYDPETGRFISPDVIAEGGNLYTYCLNDPVNRSDESGYLSDVWKKRIIKIAIGVVATTAAVAITVATGGAALPVVASVVASMAIGAGMNAAVAAIQGDDVGEAAIDGMVDGFMWGGVFAAAGATVNAIASGGTAVKAATSASPINTGTVKVYHAVEGSKHYYGITNNLSRRAAEHARNGRTIIEALDGSYTRAEARGIEQFLIEKNGGPGVLANKIYSIAKNNLNYEKLKAIGEKLKNASKWIPFN